MCSISNLAVLQILLDYHLEFMQKLLAPFFSQGDLDVILSIFFCCPLVSPLGVVLDLFP